MELFCFGQKEFCQLSFSRLLAESQREKIGETCRTRTLTDGGAKKKRKYKLLREITLEENIAETENNLNLSQLGAKKEDSGKLFQCPKCDKNYKFASGLHYHTKHYH